ncbi:MAG: hydroxymethylglutaryl-CoA lyase [Myxococcales bacterium]
MGDQVTLYEVGPRDGLQNEAARLSVAGKLRLIEALAAAGLGRIEIGSFVRPDWIPQLADTDAVARRLLGGSGGPGSLLPAGVRLSALVPNRLGLERAAAAGLREVAVFMSASESHNRKNTNKSVAGSLREFEQLVPAAVARGLTVRGYVSTVWGCPYEGAVDPRGALEIAARLRDLGVAEISLGDTIGVGNPAQTRRIVELFLGGLGQVRPFAVGELALHFHDTHGTALANCLAAYELGVRTFDASIGGTGGCPYAPGAAGNLATEDLVSMLHGMGIETGVDLDKLIDAGALAQELIGRPLPGRRLQAALGQREQGAGRAAISH